MAKHCLYSHAFPELLLNHPELFISRAKGEERSHKSRSSVRTHVCALAVQSQENQVTLLCLFKLQPLELSDKAFGIWVNAVCASCSEKLLFEGLISTSPPVLAVGSASSCTHTQISKTTRELARELQHIPRSAS